jgi:hypothetical protein
MRTLIAAQKLINLQTKSAYAVPHDLSDIKAM